MTSEKTAQSLRDGKHGLCARDSQSAYDQEYEIRARGSRSAYDQEYEIRARGSQLVHGGRTKVLPHILKISAGIAMAAAFFITALLSSTELVVYGIPGYFHHEFKKYNVYSDLPMSESEVDRVMSETMKYLRGDRERLEDVTANIDGIGETAFYNADEVSHMADVKVMFMDGLRLRNFLAVVLAICAGVLAAAAAAARTGRGSAGAGDRGGNAQEPGRRGAGNCPDGRRHPEGMKPAGPEEAGRQGKLRKKSGRDTASCVLRVFAVTELAMIAACAVTALYASTDFTSFFTRFHEIFFPQGNWEFDPAVSRMINMLPEGLFSDTAMYIVIVFALIEVIAIAAAWQAGRMKSNR